MNIAHLLFDLDSTLYPPNADIVQGFIMRTHEFVANFFHITFDEAIALRRENLKTFATTAEWLMHDGLKNPEEYLAWVHPDSEIDEIPPDEKLRPMLKSVKLPKAIFTNAPLNHVQNVLAKLNVSDLFDAVCDIYDCNFHGKPRAAAYKIALKKCGGTISDTLFFDDMIENVEGYAALGGTAVLVGQNRESRLSTRTGRQTAQKKGRALHIDSIYGLVPLLQQIADL